MKEFTLTEPALIITPYLLARYYEKRLGLNSGLGFMPPLLRMAIGPTLQAFMDDIRFRLLLLGVNSPKVFSKLWNAVNEKESLYYILTENGNLTMNAVSIRATLGGLLFIKLAGFRWHLQVSGFWILAALFVAVGVSYVLLLQTKYFAAVIVLYSLCSLFFNFGPNSSTFVVSHNTPDVPYTPPLIQLQIATEAFPTK